MPMIWVSNVTFMDALHTLNDCGKNIHMEIQPSCNDCAYGRDMSCPIRDRMLKALRIIDISSDEAIDWSCSLYTREPGPDLGEALMEHGAKPGVRRKKHMRAVSGAALDWWRSKRNMEPLGGCDYVSQDPDGELYKLEDRLEEFWAFLESQRTTLGDC